MDKYVLIYGEKIPVKFAYLPEDHASYEIEKEEIFIDENCKNKNRYLIHEICHALLVRSGISEILGARLEEAICRAMDQGLHKTLKVIVRKEDEAG